MKATLDHLIGNVLPASADYYDAELELSRIFKEDATPAHWAEAARRTKRRAAELAIAIDGLTDRAALETSLSKTDIRNRIAALCIMPGGTVKRVGSESRVRAVANAYKHLNLSDPGLPISSDADVLVVGLGYGLEGFGVGKFGGIEVIVRETSRASWKFLGDAPTAISAWFQFLVAQGAAIPKAQYSACNLQVYP